MENYKEIFRIEKNKSRRSREIEKEKKRSKRTFSTEIKTNGNFGRAKPEPKTIECSHCNYKLNNSIFRKHVKYDLIFYE